MPRRVPTRISPIGRALVTPIAGLLALVAMLALAVPVAAAPTLGPGGPLPLTFEPNLGQADASVKFLARGRGCGLFQTPSETVFVLVPTERTLDGRRPQPRTPSTVTIKEDDVAGAITFSADVFAVTECAASPCQAVPFLSRTTLGVASNVTVDFATEDGTPTALNDYVATTGTINFAYLQTTQRIVIPLQIEPGAQPPKSFRVRLSNPRGGATLGTRTSTEVRITDTR